MAALTMTKKVITFFRKKYRVTLSFTAPGDTNAGDATGGGKLRGEMSRFPMYINLCTAPAARQVAGSYDTFVPFHFVLLINSAVLVGQGAALHSHTGPSGHHQTMANIWFRSV